MYIDYRIGHIRLSEEEMAEIRANGGVSEEEYMYSNGYLGSEHEAGAEGYDDGVINGIADKTINTIEEPIDEPVGEPVGDPIPEPTVDPIGDPIPEPIVAPVEEPTDLPKSKDKKDDDKDRPTIIGIIGIGLATFVLACQVRSCDPRHPNIEFPTLPTEYTRTVEHEEVEPFKVSYYDVNGPQDNVLGETGESGQEGIVNNVIAGEEESLYGADYDSYEHGKDEAKSVEGFDEFIQSRKQVAQDMSELEDPNLTQDEIKARLDSIQDETQAMEEQYKSREELADRAAETFDQRTHKNPDQISDDETKVVEEMKDTFYREEEAVSESSTNIEELQRKMEEGQEIKIDGIEQDKHTGEYEITGEAIETVVEEQKFTGIQAIWESFKDWVKGEQQLEQEQDQIQKSDTNQR